MNKNFYLFYISICLVCCSLRSAAQLGIQHKQGELLFGLQMGGTNSQITHIEDAVLPEQDYFTDYSIHTRWRPQAPSFGLFFNLYGFDGIALTAETSYAPQGGHMEFSNIKQYAWTMDFNYQYINFSPALTFEFSRIFENKWPGGFYMSLGYQLSFTTQPHKIKFSSDTSPGYEPGFKTDAFQEGEYNRILSGEKAEGPTGSFGYTLDNFSLEGRVFRGVNSMINVGPNDYNMIQKDIRLNTIEIRLKYAFHLKKFNFEQKDL